MYTKHNWGESKRNLKYTIYPESNNVQFPADALFKQP